MQLFVKPPFFTDEGAMHLGHGKFILPVFAPGTAKEASPKAKNVLTVAVCAVIVLCLVAAIVLSYQEPLGLPMQSEVLESLGKPLPEVAELLDVPVEGMQQVEPGLYRIVAAGKLKGITFDILLQFEPNEGLLRNYGYEARCDANAAKADKALNTITKALALEEDTLEDESFSGTAKRQLEMHRTDDGGFTADATLSGTSLPAAALSEYMDYLESADYYEGRVGKYLVKNAMYYEELQIVYDPEQEELAIELWCTIETDRTKDY